MTYALHPYHYFYNYVPQNIASSSTLRNEYSNQRQEIWSFKSGYNQSNFLNKTLEYIEEIKKNNPNKDIIFIPIPASTDYNNNRRFKNFSNSVCSQAGIINGFGYLKNINDREARHISGICDTNSNLECINESFNDKIIIVFDDVITSGNSFNNACNLILRNNPSTLLGLFLGKTIEYDEIGFYLK